MNIFSIPPFITSFLVLLLGLFAYSKNSKSPTNRAFFCLCASVALWLLMAFIAYNSHDAIVANYFMRFSYIGIVNIPTTVFHFTVLFLGLDKLRRLIPVLYMVAFFSVFLILSTDFIISGVYLYFWGFYPRAGSFHWIFLTSFVFVAGLCFSLLLFNFIKKVNSGVKRQQLKYVILAFCFLNLASFDFVPNYGVALYPFGFIPTSIFLGIVTYSIIKYRLLNITTLIARTAIFVLVYSFVLGIPFAFGFSLHDWLVSLFGVNWWIAPLIVSTILATAGPFFYLYVDNRAEERLSKEQRGYQNILKGASSGMIRIKNLSRLLNLIVRVVTKTVRISHTSVYLRSAEGKGFNLCASRGLEINNQIRSSGVEFIDAGSPLIWMLASSGGPVVSEEIAMRVSDDPSNQGLLKLSNQLKDLHAALAVPSFIEKKLIGILILGEKRSGKLYSQDDLNVFSVLANQAALAIENAQFYDEIKNTHQQLFQAEKLATIGTMADGLSHQINNRFHALSLIAGDAMDILKTGNFSLCDEKGRADLADVKSALERIEANVIQGGEVVKGLLKYSRPGDGGFESVDFKDVLNGAIDMVQFKIKLKEIDLVQSLPEGIPRIYANTIQLQEVFFNLIDNAYDATKERQSVLKEEGYRGKIEVSAVGADNYLVVNVSDNGMGIKDVDKKKLFTPFFTTKATAKKGTGLGLYVIERIISAHGGKIDIQSTHQQGTTFAISLPINPKSAA